MIRTVSGRMMTLAGVAIGAACSAPGTLVERPLRAPAWIDAGTPSHPREREIRFYSDEKRSAAEDVTRSK